MCIRDRWFPYGFRGAVPSGVHARDNDRWYYGYADTSDDDLRHRLEAGRLEGPSHYSPSWVVSPQAGMHLPEKGEY
eukprot:8716819-Pyramimonas_sp.AAC.1